ncbi:MAG TPA: DUF4268 domain-containing protein [Brumimicrobium sp.]|nr:DUF4268 domain-containing protein [Brumimicrobium sp.]
MFSKEERKAINTAFWTRFKEKSGVNKGANGKRINWVNYPTHLKQIYVRLHADTESARFSIDIQDKDEGVRSLIWEQFIELKKVLDQEMIIPAVWEEKAYNSANQPISRISWTLEDVNMYEKEDQHKIYDFFILLSLRFDRFYSTYDEILIGLLK